MGFETPADAMDEIAALTPDFAGVTYERHRPHGPAVAGRAGRHRLADPLRGGVRRSPAARRQFAALPYKAPGDAADDEFPLILVTGRRLQHYNAGTMTRRTGNLELHRATILEIHPDDAERLWITDGELVSVAQHQAARSRSPRRSPTGSSPATSSPRSTSRRCARTC